MRTPPPPPAAVAAAVAADVVVAVVAAAKYTGTLAQPLCRSHHQIGRAHV